jgi:hypothetical protein
VQRKIYKAHEQSAATKVRREGGAENALGGLAGRPPQVPLVQWQTLN